MTALLLTALPLSAENNDTDFQDVKKKILEAYSSLEDYTTLQQEQAINSIKETLDTLDQKLESLQMKFDREHQNMSEATLEKYKAVMQELQHRREELGLWYEKFKQSSNATLDKLKKDFSEAYQDLNQTYHDSDDKKDTPKKEDYFI